MEIHPPPKITSIDTVEAAEKVLHDILKSSDDAVSMQQKRQAAEFVLSFNHELGHASKTEGLATKDDIERLGRIIGETKEVLSCILREGGRAPGLTAIGSRESILPVQGSA